MQLGDKSTDRPGVADIDLPLLLFALFIIVPRTLKPFADPHQDPKWAAPVGQRHINAETPPAAVPPPILAASERSASRTGQDSQLPAATSDSLRRPALTGWLSADSCRHPGGPITPGCPRTAAPMAGCGRPCTCPALRPSRPPARTPTGFPPSLT